MTRLTVAQVKDLSNQGGMSFSNGTITANGTLNVTNIVINGNVSGSSGYIVPSQSGPGLNVQVVVEVVLDMVNLVLLVPIQNHLLM